VWEEIPIAANVAMTAAVPRVASRFKIESSFQQQIRKHSFFAFNYSKREKLPFPLSDAGGVFVSALNVWRTCAVHALRVCSP
jgi:hypothetical protein